MTVVEQPDLANTDSAVTKWFFSTDVGRESDANAGIRRLYCDLIRLPDPFDVNALMVFLR